jgi:hypothetical protein
MTKTIVDGVTRDMTSAEQAVFDGYQLTDAEFAAKELDLLRVERNRLLAETDYVVAMHTELGTSIPSNMATYRQALRDITGSATSLQDVTFPTKP